MRSRVRFTVTILTVFLLAFTLVGCAGTTKEVSPTAPMFPIEIMDQAGRSVSLNKMPEKIVSLAPSNTEVVYALGLEERLAGVTEFCDYPEAALIKPKIGGFSTVDIEKVVEIQPELILATDRHQAEIVPELERLGFTTIILAPKSIDEAIATINLVGQAAGVEDRAARLVDEMRVRVKAVTAKTNALTQSQRPRVLLLVWHDPLIAAGSKSILHELIGKAGGTNIAGDIDDDYPKMNLETVIIADPQVIISAGGHSSGDNLPYEFATSETRLAVVAARSDNRIYWIDADLTNRPGPRIIDGLEEIARLLEPGFAGQGVK